MVDRARVIDARRHREAAMVDMANFCGGENKYRSFIDLERLQRTRMTLERCLRSAYTREFGTTHGLARHTLPSTVPGALRKREPLHSNANQSCDKKRRQQLRTGQQVRRGGVGGAYA